MRGLRKGLRIHGWLIVEDLVTVLILVLLPALAASLGGQPIGSDSAGHDNSSRHLR